MTIRVRFTYMDSVIRRVMATALGVNAPNLRITGLTALSMYLKNVPHVATLGMVHTMERGAIMSQPEPIKLPENVSFYEGDANWHDGPGWYYVFSEYPDEGSVGAFATKDEAIAHAIECTKEPSE